MRWKPSSFPNMPATSSTTGLAQHRGQAGPFGELWQAGTGLAEKCYVAPCHAWKGQVVGREVSIVCVCFSSQIT